jgi:hypothetical protein
LAKIVAQKPFCATKTKMSEYLILKNLHRSILIIPSSKILDHVPFGPKLKLAHMQGKLLDLGGLLRLRGRGEGREEKTCMSVFRNNDVIVTQEQLTRVFVSLMTSWSLYKTKSMLRIH